MTRAESSLQSYHRNSEKINARKRELRERITYDPRPCEACGLDYQPLRSTSRFCQRKACINRRQNANRAKRKETT